MERIVLIFSRHLILNFLLLILWKKQKAINKRYSILDGCLVYYWNRQQELFLIIILNI